MEQISETNLPISQDILAKFWYQLVLTASDALDLDNLNVGILLAGISTTFSSINLTNPDLSPYRFALSGMLASLDPEEADLQTLLTVGSKEDVDWISSELMTPDEITQVANWLCDCLNILEELSPDLMYFGRCLIASTDAEAFVQHPYIQCGMRPYPTPRYTLRLIGLLNGALLGHEYIAESYDDVETHVFTGYVVTTSTVTFVADDKDVTVMP